MQFLFKTVHRAIIVGITLGGMAVGWINHDALQHSVAPQPSGLVELRTQCKIRHFKYYIGKAGNAWVAIAGPGDETHSTIASAPFWLHRSSTIDDAISGLLDDMNRAPNRQPDVEYSGP